VAVQQHVRRRHLSQCRWRRRWRAPQCGTRRGSSAALPPAPRGSSGSGEAALSSMARGRPRGRGGALSSIVISYYFKRGVYLSGKTVTKILHYRPKFQRPFPVATARPRWLPVRGCPTCATAHSSSSPRETGPAQRRTATMSGGATAAGREPLVEMSGNADRIPDASKPSEAAPSAVVAGGTSWDNLSEAARAAHRETVAEKSLQPGAGLSKAQGPSKSQKRNKKAKRAQVGLRSALSTRWN